MKDTPKDSFILYAGQYDTLKVLSDDQLGKIIRALYIYVGEGTEPSFGDMALAMAFGFIRKEVDRARQRYDEICEKRRQYGKMGGRPKKTTETESTRFLEKQTKPYGFSEKQMKPSETYTDTDTDTDTEFLYTEEHSIKEEEEEEKRGRKKKAGVDFEKIRAYWNTKAEECGASVRPISAMTQMRKDIVSLRVKEFGGDEASVYKVIDTALSSPFCNGRNDKGWVITFEKAFSSQWFTKLLEGNCDPVKFATDKGASVRPPTQPATEPTPEQKEAAMRSRIVKMIELAKRNPKSACVGSLRAYRDGGTLKRLGIEWDG